MNCKYIYNKKEFSETELYDTLKKIIDSDAGKYFKMFSFSSSIESIISKSKDDLIGYISTRDFLTSLRKDDSDKVFLASSSTADVGTRLIAEYNAENRKKSMIEDWKESHPDEEITSDKLQEFEDIITLDSQKGTIYKKIHSFLGMAFKSEGGVRNAIKDWVIALQPYDLSKDKIERKKVIDENTLRLLFGESRSIFVTEARDTINDEIEIVVDKIYNTIIPVVERLKSSYSGTGYNQKIYLDRKNKLKAKIGFVGISNSSGLDIVNVIEFIGGEKSFEDWDPAKKLTSDYRLGLDRVILENSGIPFDRITLSVVPINFTYGNFLDTFTISFENLQVRSGDILTKSGLGESGMITENLKPFSFGKPSVSVASSEDIDNLATNIYKITNGLWTPRLDVNVKSVEEEVKRIVEKSDGKTYVFYKVNGTSSKKITTHSIEELTEEVKKYHKELENNKEKLVDDIIKTFNEKATLSSPDSHANISDLFGSFKDDAVKKLITARIGPYLDGKWVALENNALKINGIIALQNKESGVIDIIKLTSNDIDEQYILKSNSIGRPTANTILGGYLDNDDAYKKDPSMPISDVGNLEIMAALVVANTNPALFNLDKLKLGEVYSMSVRTGKSRRCNGLLLKAYSTLANYANLPNNFNTGKIRLASLIHRLDHSIKSVFSLISNKTLLKKIDDHMKELMLLGGSLAEKSEKIKHLKSMLSDIESEYNLTQEDLTKNPDFSRPEIYLLGLISDALAYYIKLDYTNEARLSEYGVLALDALGFIIDMVGYNRTKVDSKGRMIVGLAQGALLSGSANTPSLNIKKVLLYINSQILKIRFELNPEIEKIQLHTIKFYNDSGRSTIKRFFIGDNYDLYNSLFEKDANGRITQDFLVKNPFDMSNDLTATQREYLKNILWQIHKFKIKKLTEELRRGSFEAVKDNEEVLKYISQGLFVKIPLKRASDLNRFHGMTFQEMYTVYPNLKVQELKDLFDGRNLDETRRQVFDLEKKNYSRYPDLYGIDDATRLKFIESLEIFYWETNLDMIAMDVAFSAMKRVIFTDTLTTVRQVLYSWKMLANSSGVDIEKLLKFLEDLVKITVFNEPIIDDELEDLTKLIKVTRVINSALQISFRPFQWVKEMTVGWIRNWSLALVNVIKLSEYDFNFNDVKLAMGFMIGHVYDRTGQLVKSKDEDIASFTLLNALNNHYGIANMDINSIIQKLKTDRYGFSAGLSKWMYWCSTNPDLYNRMIMFVALMYHDNCLEAHSIKDGALVYDMSKDKRFSEYYAHRHEKGYTSKEFLKLKALYTVMMEEFIELGYKDKDGKLLKLGDDLPMAYTTKQRDALKELSDTMYGCYDHEAKMLAEHKFLGILTFLFKTYWSGAVRRWLASSATLTSRGHYVLGYEEDGTLRYIKYIRNADGTFTTMIVHETDEEYDEFCEPEMFWLGDFMEGCLVSMIKTLRDCGYFLTNSIGITNQKLQFSRERLGNCLLGLHDLLFAYLLYLLVDIMFFGEPAKEHFKDKNKTYSGEELALLKVRNIFKNASSEFGIDLVMPFNSWEPTQFQSLHRGITGLLDNIKADDPDFGNFLERNIRAIGDFTEVKVRK